MKKITTAIIIVLCGFAFSLTLANPIQRIHKNFHSDSSKIEVPECDTIYNYTNFIDGAYVVDSSKYDVISWKYYSKETEDGVVRPDETRERSRQEQNRMRFEKTESYKMLSKLLDNQEESAMVRYMLMQGYIWMF